MTLREAITHPWLTVRVQIALGAIFIVAAWPKLLDPPSFAHMIYNYRILPGGLINITSLIMPWAEIIAGLALILGVWTRGARWLIGLMLVVFMIAITINLLRNNAIDCGCFNVADAGKTHEERIKDMWIVLIRDAGMLLMIAQMWYAERVRGTTTAAVAPPEAAAA
ncbi:MAG TPA: MauE/DoxX family redox-associated membrane protein [Thermoanaerobaculia bacterium]